MRAAIHEKQKEDGGLQKKVKSALLDCYCAPESENATNHQSLVHELFEFMSRKGDDQERQQHRPTLQAKTMGRDKQDVDKKADKKKQDEKADKEKKALEAKKAKSKGGKSPGPQSKT